MHTSLCATFILCSTVLAQDDKLDRGIADTGGRIDVFVRMTDQLFATGADFPAFCAKHKDAKRRALRKQMIATLQKKSEESWQRIKKRIEALGDEVQGIKRYWVVNGFACFASGDACRSLATEDSVSFVYRRPRGVPSLRATRARRFGQLDDKANAEQALAELELAAREGFPELNKLSPTWNVARIKDGAGCDHRTHGFGSVDHPGADPCALAQPDNAGCVAKPRRTRVRLRLAPCQPCR